MLTLCFMKFGPMRRTRVMRKNTEQFNRKFVQKGKQEKKGKGRGQRRVRKNESETL